MTPFRIIVPAEASNKSSVRPSSFSFSFPCGDFFSGDDSFSAFFSLI
jgi:hypothetical protein